MPTQTTLFLHEEIMLLALRDREGTVEFGSMYQYAIGGAILAELLLTKRIAVDESRRKKLANVLPAEAPGDPVIDECYAKIKNAKRRATLETWVSRFANLRDLKHRVAKQLCRRGILRADEDKVLLIFTRKIYPEVNPEPERAIIQRLRTAIFTDTADLDARTVILLSLAKSADLLKFHFDKKELKTRKDRIKRIVNGEIAGSATKGAIEAMQAAVMVATIIPAIVASTTVTTSS
ncbi:MAG: GPP34 family phosphoprotein [bacterium]